jgi:hypothetical protein
MNGGSTDNVTSMVRLDPFYGHRGSMFSGLIITKYVSLFVVLSDYVRIIYNNNITRLF